MDAARPIAEPFRHPAMLKIRPRARWLAPSFERRRPSHTRSSQRPSHTRSSQRRKADMARAGYRPAGLNVLFHAAVARVRRYPKAATFITITDLIRGSAATMLRTT